MGVGLSCIFQLWWPGEGGGRGIAIHTHIHTHMCIYIYIYIYIYIHTHVHTHVRTLLARPNPNRLHFCIVVAGEGGEGKQTKNRLLNKLGVLMRARCTKLHTRNARGILRIL